MSLLEERRFVVETLDPQMAEVLRQKTGAESLQIAWKMWASARDMIHNYLAASHPDWTDEQVRRETARRLSHGAV